MDIAGDSATESYPTSSVREQFKDLNIQFTDVSKTSSPPLLFFSLCSSSPQISTTYDLTSVIQRIPSQLALAILCTRVDKAVHFLTYLPLPCHLHASLPPYSSGSSSSTQMVQ